MVNIQFRDDVLIASTDSKMVFLDSQTLYSAYRSSSYRSYDDLIQDFRLLQKNNPSDSSNVDITKKNLMLRLLITGRCNMNCSYCQMRNLTQYHNTDMSLDCAKKILDEVNLRDYDYITIHFSGGEPLMVSDLVEKICSYAINIGLPNIRFAMSTNGTFLTQKVISMLQKYNIKVVVSIDGYRNANSNRVFHSNEGTDDLVLKSCQKMIEYGIPIGVSMVFNEKYADQSAYSVEKLINQYNIRSLGFNYRHYPAFRIFEKQQDNDSMTMYATQLCNVYKVCRKSNVFEEQSNRVIEPFVYQHPRKSHCTSQTSQSSFMPDGIVSPCKTFAASNMDSASIDEWVDNSECNLPNFYQWRSRNVDTLEDCKYCAYRNMCGGGCAYEAYVMNKSILTKDSRYCVVPKQIYRSMMEVLFKSILIDECTDTFVPLSLEQRKLLLSCSVPDRYELTASIGHYLE